MALLGILLDLQHREMAKLSRKTLLYCTTILEVLNRKIYFVYKIFLKSVSSKKIKLNLTLELPGISPFLDFRGLLEDSVTQGKMDRSTGFEAGFSLF